MLERTALRCSLLASVLFFLGPVHLWGQLTSSPTLTTNFGNASPIIACSSGTLEYTVRATTKDPNTVLYYRYVRNRSGSNTYLTSHTVSATVTHNDFSQTVQDGDQGLPNGILISQNSDKLTLSGVLNTSFY